MKRVSVPGGPWSTSVSVSVGSTVEMVGRIRASTCANTSTLPLQIYSMIKIAVTPEVNAISTLLMGLTLFLIIVASKLAPSALRSSS